MYIFLLEDGVSDIDQGRFQKKKNILAAPWAFAYRQQNNKWQQGSPKMADRVWEGVYP